MQYRELKQDSLRLIRLNNWKSLEEVSDDLKAQVPVRYLRRWLNQIAQARELPAIPQFPRLVNRFSIGSDPEFGFSQVGGGYVDAVNYGMQAGLAFGADNNSRLVELRPTPSRFALDIVASILAELRWMVHFCPGTLGVEWQAVAYDGRDGQGGHVHFARKTDAHLLNAELNGLDYLFDILNIAQVYNRKDCDNRQARAHYGMKHDYRKQAYGYEYRTLPTWMCSPWLAYFSIVMAKLFVHNPGKALDSYQWVLNAPDKKAAARKAIYGLLTEYKNVDDDALIAYHALNLYGLPKSTNEDFKAQWGILYPQKVQKEINFVPGMIAPTETERQRIFDYLVKGTPIFPDIPVCNWEPKQIPKGFVSGFTHNPSAKRKGIGEIVFDLVYNNDLPLNLMVKDREHQTSLHIPPEYMHLIQPIQRAWKAVFGENQGEELIIQVNAHQTFMLTLPPNLRDANGVKLVRRFLCSGVFPVWHIKDAKEESFQKFLDFAKAVKPQRAGGKQIGGL